MLTSLGGIDHWLRWSPDSSSIVLTYQNDIYVVAASGGIPERLTSDPALKASWPSYSHDGRWIYLGSPPDGDTQIWRIPAGGGSAVQITRNGGTQPLESPGGEYLFFLRGRADEFFVAGPRARLWNGRLFLGRVMRSQQGTCIVCCSITGITPRPLIL